MSDEYPNPSDIDYEGGVRLVVVRTIRDGPKGGRYRQYEIAQELGPTDRFITGQYPVFDRLRDAKHWLATASAPVSAGSDGEDRPDD